jgi:hypothetical protein
MKVPSISYNFRKPQYHQTVKDVFPIDKSMTQSPMEKLSYYKGLPKTANKLYNEKEFSVIGVEKPGTAYSRDASKEKYRKKWEKLSKRTLFNFVVDIDSNEVSLVRIKKRGVEDEVQSKVRTRMKVEGHNLSPHLQKKKGIKPRKDSIKVYYGLGSESPSKAIGVIEASEEMNSKKQLFKSILTSNVKVSLKLKKFLETGSMKTTFDLNNIKLAEIDAGSYFHLYLSLRQAVTPTFYNLNNKKINELDPDIISALNDNVPLTDYDTKIVTQYKQSIEDIKKGILTVGFWRVRRVYGCKPTCRESLTIASFEGKYYLFGGYGVDRMNDLWCLSVQDEEITSGVYNWTAIHTLGSKIPSRRYGHCMTAYGNDIYIFGGSSEFITGLKIRTILNDIWRYSIEDNRWYEVERNALGRMYAASCTFGDIWFIHGGNNGCPRNALSSSVIYSFSKCLSND